MKVRSCPDAFSEVAEIVIANAVSNNLKGVIIRFSFCVLIVRGKYFKEYGKDHAFMPFYLIITTQADCGNHQTLAALYF
jgi:hypothetical protein